jgi:homoserine/homoserine lactone efflux protein
MLGEVIGVLLVASLAGLGMAGVMLAYPRLFALLKWIGGAYIIWLGIQLWRSRGALSLDAAALEGRRDVSPRALALQGFVTAIANPKGWAFFMALLPPFLLTESLINAHFVLLMLIIAVSELMCMTLYAAGGQSMRRLLSHRGNVAVINRIAGTLMFGVGVWLALS